MGTNREPPMPEDDEGGWTRMFAVGKKPSAYLINARREFVWKHERARSCEMGGPRSTSPVRRWRRSSARRCSPSWSAPCLADLSRLRRPYETGKGTPFIVALHGGSNSDALADIRGPWGCRSFWFRIGSSGPPGDMASAASRPHDVCCYGDGDGLVAWAVLV